MRVEFRRRPAKGAQDPVKRSASASPSLVKAYSDSCFESPTSFYIASPEHPKLGKWAQPSTLKYSLPPQQHTTHNATRCVALFASNHGRPHTTGRNPITRAKNTWKAVSVSESRSKKGPSHQRLKEPERPERPASPVGSLLVGCSNSSPSSSIRGRREAPHIDTPVSGRVRDTKSKYQVILLLLCASDASCLLSSSKYMYTFLKTLHAQSDGS